MSIWLRILLLLLCLITIVIVDAICSDGVEVQGHNLKKVIIRISWVIYGIVIWNIIN